MSNQIQPYDFRGNTIRTTVDDNGNPLFCAKDVARRSDTLTRMTRYKPTAVGS